MEDFLNLMTVSLRRLSAHFRTGAVLRQSVPDGLGQLQYSAVTRPMMGKYLPQLPHCRTGISRRTHSRREKSIKFWIVSGHRISPQPPFLITPKLMGTAQSERVLCRRAGQRSKPLLRFAGPLCPPGQYPKYAPQISALVLGIL